MVPLVFLHELGGLRMSSSLSSSSDSDSSSSSSRRDVANDGCGWVFRTIGVDDDLIVAEPRLSAFNETKREVAGSDGSLS